MSFFDRPEILSRPDSYFAALNSARGFRSFFPALFDSYRKIVIKGGPGCGKSTLMKKIADAATAAGLSADRYFCSSDTDSLDAVAIPELSTVILDGTAPHTVEPYCPGAKDRILDLSAFWSFSRLRENETAIDSLNRAIGRKYARAYALMRSVAAIEDAVHTETALLFNEAAARKILDRLLCKYKIKAEPGSAFSCRIRPAAAFGVKGYLALDTYEKKAKTIVAVKDRHLFSPFFFALLKKLLTERGVSFELSLRPVDEEIEALYLPDSSLLFTLRACENPSVTINLERMLYGKGKGASKGQKALLKEIPLLCGAIRQELAEAGRLHDELETYYIAATDYAALNRFTETLIPALLRKEY